MEPKTMNLGDVAENTLIQSREENVMRTPEAMVANLREMADFLDTVEWPDGVSVHSASTVIVSCSTKKQFGEACRCLGPAEKSDHEDTLFYRRRFGGFSVVVMASKSVTCDRVLVTKTLPASREIVIPAKPERVEEAYEYRCPESFLSLGKSEAEVDQEDGSAVAAFN